MKDISDVIQKLEESKVDLGENSNQEDYVYTDEIAKKIQDQGNVELVELRQTTKYIQCQACWKHIPEGMIKCCCGYGTCRCTKKDANKNAASVKQPKTRPTQMVRIEKMVKTTFSYHCH